MNILCWALQIAIFNKRRSKSTCHSNFHIYYYHFLDCGGHLELMIDCDLSAFYFREESEAIERDVSHIEFAETHYGSCYTLACLQTRQHSGTLRLIRREWPQKLIFLGRARPEQPRSWNQYPIWRTQTDARGEELKNFLESVINSTERNRD